VSAVGAKSLRALHVSEALFRLMPSPITPPLCLFQGTQESYFTQGALVFVLPNIVSHWTIKETNFLQLFEASFFLVSSADMLRQQTLKTFSEKVNPRTAGKEHKNTSKKLLLVRNNPERSS